MREVLKLKNITKAFPGVIALSDMTFDLRAGEIHAICGENGAGKSTLMKIVSGVIKADSGQVVVNGEVCHFKNPKEAVEKGIAIIHQETSLFEQMTVMDNIFLGYEETKKVMGVSVLDYKKMRSEIQRIYNLMNIDIDVNEKIQSLGMAQKQMIEIAKALTFDAKILILDEPTASLTQREVEALFSILRKLRSEGTGIVFISHRMDDIFGLCDRVTVIRDGCFISCRDMKDTTHDDIVSDMVGRSLNSFFVKTNVATDQELFRVQDLNQYGVLKDIQLIINKGEIVGLSGLAGAGRTELAQAICGLTKRDSGEIFLEGEPIKIDNYSDAMKNEIVYVSEDRGKYGLILDMNIKHNITLPILNKLFKKAFLKKETEEKTAQKYIKDLDIKTPNSDFIVANLSGGNQQKVSLSKALAVEPKLLILDEPTRGVDINAKAEIHALISKFAEKGLSILMISSEMPEILSMCDRIYVMRNGMIVGELDKAEATQEKILKTALQVN